ncbi:MAG TPA: 1-(5-phosphoribosyl)-5-[(5-phosphoribosylamino)methylideneamino]imidazole-4-carboxamide isomerase [Planctomycetota bacterium]|nr:1-(5-phosphoribosyl)-5-[(5-phosphoribosylamino)methylideneamino]imidazole-4-carboxamide isomerase [Planctomycetota bacterium]
MIVIPAIDIKAGRCVRLVQGAKDSETVYSANPVEVAKQWQEAGAEMIHVVDLDGAFAGKPQNIQVLASIRRAVDVPIEFGGGLRSYADVDVVLKLGVTRAIIGTRAVVSPEWIAELCRRHSGKIAAGIDARDGMVAVEGWTEGSDITAADLARRMAEAGVCAVIFTDIARDGMLTGVNVAAAATLADEVPVPVIASGGVASLDDIRRLRETKVSGAVIGKALYAGTIDLRDAIEVAAGKA